MIEDPRTSTPGLGLLLWIKEVYGDEAGEAWTKLKPRILTVSKGWSEAYGLFPEGEAPMVLSYTTSPAYHIIAEKTDKYAAAPFAEGHYMQVEVAGRIAGSPQQRSRRQVPRLHDLARRSRTRSPTTNWMYPVSDADGRAAEGVRPARAAGEVVAVRAGGGRRPSQAVDRRVVASDESMIRRLVPGALTFLLLGLVIGGAFAGLLRAAGTVELRGLPGRARIPRRVVTFTVWQALLSTLLSVGPAILVARALARAADFPGRALLLRLFGLPLVLPTIVAIFGVVAIYGQSGWSIGFLAAPGHGAAAVPLRPSAAS